MAGAIKPGVAVSVATGASVIAGGIKLLAKSSASGAGKYLTAKAGAGALVKGGVVASVGSRGALIGVSEYEASAALSQTTSSLFRSNPEILSNDNLPDLFRKYPGLSLASKDPAEYEAFLAKNPKFIEDASISLYRRDPALFAKSFGESRFIGLNQDGFGVVIHERVRSQNEDAVKKLLSSVADSLAKKGFPASKLEGMEEKALEKLVEKALAQEIDRKLKSAEYTWAYKSGTLSVKGDIGHFTFEQELSIAGIAKTVAMGSAAFSGYKIVWNKDSFVQAQTCIDAFCINLDSRKRTLTATSELAEKSAVPTPAVQEN